jgi:hypothetical protein
MSCDTRKGGSFWVGALASRDRSEEEIPRLEIAAEGVAGLLEESAPVLGVGFGPEGGDELVQLRLNPAVIASDVENTGVKLDETLGKRYVAFKDPDRIAWEFYHA